MTRLLIPLMVAAAVPLSAQTSFAQVPIAQGVTACLTTPFAQSAIARDLLVRAWAVSVPGPVPPALYYPARMAVLDVLKGELAAAEIDVLVSDLRLPLRAGEEWLLALSTSGSLAIGRCGVFAVRVDGDEAVGRIHALHTTERVPIERIRELTANP
jgi:hypothetical protein